MPIAFTQYNSQLEYWPSLRLIAPFNLIVIVKIRNNTVQRYGFSFRSFSLCSCRYLPKWINPVQERATSKAQGNLIERNNGKTIPVIDIIPMVIFWIFIEGIFFMIREYINSAKNSDGKNQSAPAIGMLSVHSHRNV